MLHDFLLYLLGEEAAGRSVLYACSCYSSLCLCKWECPNTGLVVFCVSVCGVFSHKSSIVFLLTELFNICRFKLASLSAAFTFFVSTTPSFHFVSKIVLEVELGEALNDKEIYLKNDLGTQIVSVATSLVSPTVLEPDSHISLVRMVCLQGACMQHCQQY